MKNTHWVYKQSFWVLGLSLGLTGCADKKMEPSSEAFSSAADVHSNSRAIAETAEIDALLDSREFGILGGPVNLFDKETELLQRGTAAAPVPPTEKPPASAAPITVTCMCIPPIPLMAMPLARWPLLMTPTVSPKGSQLKIQVATICSSPSPWIFMQ